MENSTKVNFRRKSFALIAIVLMMTSALLTTATFTAKAAGTDYVAGSPMQGTTSGVVGDLSSGATPSYTVDSVAFLSVSPSPIGVGQYALVNMWITPPISPNRFLSGFYVDDCKARWNYRNCRSNGLIPSRRHSMVYILP